MKTRIYMLAFGICLAWVSVAVAACQTVNTADFQGQVCTNPGRESRSGIWIDQDGGVFEGGATYIRNPDSSSSLMKNGTITSSVVQARMTYQQVRDRYGKISSIETLQGKEILADGGTFEGNKTIERRPDRSLTIRKDGMVNSAVVQARLIYQELQDPYGRASSQETLNGKEILADGGTFEGNKTIARNPDRSQMIRKDGKVSSAVLQARLLYQEMQDPMGKVSSIETLSGREILADGGTFEGNKTIERRPDRSLTIRKDGMLNSAVVQARLVYQEAQDPYGRVSSQETLSGKWLIAPTLKLQGNMTVQRAPTGPIIVRDERRQIP